MALFAFTLFNALKWHAPKEWHVDTFITVLALFFVSGTASVGFIAPIIFIAVMAKIYSRRRAIFIPMLGGSGVFVVLAVYYLKTGNNSLTRLLVPLIGDTGNLGRSLNLLQVVGISIVLSLLVPCVAVVGISYFFGGIWLTSKAIAVASLVLILSAEIGAYELWITLRKNERKFALNLKLHYLQECLVSAIFAIG